MRRNRSTGGGRAVKRMSWRCRIAAGPRSSGRVQRSSDACAADARSAYTGGRVADMTTRISFSMRDRLEDREVSPSHVALGELKDFCARVAEFLRGEQKDLSAATLLVAIRKGSLSLDVHDVPPESSVWNDLSSLASSEELGAIDEKRAALVLNWQERSRDRASFEIHITTDRTDRGVRINAQSNFRKSSDPVWVTAERYLVGEAVDVGGSRKPNLHLRQASGLTIMVSSERALLRGIERNVLYRNVVARVLVEERLDTGAVRNARLLGLNVLQPPSTRRRSRRWSRRAPAAGRASTMRRPG